MSAERVQIRTNDSEIRRRANLVLKDIQDLFREQGEEFKDEDLNRIVSDPPSKTHFPIIMFTLAVIKDVVDVLLSASLIGYIPAMIISVIYGVVLFFWVVFNLSGGWWLKRIKKKIYWRFVVTTLAEVFGPFIPANSFFVYLVYRSKSKIGKLMDTALEKVRDSNILNYIEKV